MRFMLFILAAMAVVAAPAYAQMDSAAGTPRDSATQAQDAVTQTRDASQNMDPASSTAAPAAGAAATDSIGSSKIEATVASIDMDKGELKINDLSGTERTYQVSDKESLKDLKEGDQVKITPDTSDPAKAQSVEKNDQGAQNQNMGL